MNNAYRKMMEQQSLSAEAKQAFCRNLLQEKPKRGKSVLLKTAIAAVCVAALLPVTVFAVENIFGVSLVKSVIGRTSTGDEGIGYEVTYTGTSARPLTDFAEAVRAVDGSVTKVYDSWQDAEAELGITLVNNDVLFGEGVTKEASYNLKADGLPERVHCFATHQGKDGQLYRATVTAGYRMDDMSVTLRSSVSCEHPAIPAEQVENMHWSGVLYEGDDVAEIQQEQYTAESGLTATILSVARTEGRSTDYEATFTANGASYRITIDSNVRDDSRDAEAKEKLIEVLEGFEF